MQGVDLEEGRSRWLKRIAALAVVVIIGGCAAFFINRAMAGGTQKATTLQAYTVGTMTLQSKVTTSGTAVSEKEAQLTFTLPGQVQTIYVKIGDSVTRGQPLISLKAEDLGNSAATAQAALMLAQLQLQKLQEGATDTDKARADEAVSAAQAALTKAQNDLTDATDPPTNAQLTAAQQAVATAEAGLSAAQNKLQTLKDGASDADLAAAQAALDSAQSKLSQANTALGVAQNQEGDAQSGFEYAASSYCNLSDALSGICTSLQINDYQGVLTTTQVHDLMESVQATGTPDPALAILQEAVTALVTANDTYRSAIAVVASANDSVTAARSGVDAAQKALNKAEDGASSDDIDSAQKAVDSAQAAVDAAQAAYQKLLDGATDTMIANLNAAVSKAQADLAAATTARDEVYAGAKATDLAMAAAQVRQAELLVNKANIALNNATLVAPFDGVVSALPVKIGQVVSPSVSAITVLTPGTLVLELNVGETELPSIQLGQSGTVTFDAIPTKAFPIQVYAVSLSPETQQGIVIYKVRCTISGDLETAPKPSPGMSGSASLVTQQKPDVVAIPSAAVHSRAGASVVELFDDQGNTSNQPVVTGMSDGDNIEVVKGLNVGDKIAMHTLPVPTKAAEGQEIPGHFQ